MGQVGFTNDLPVDVLEYLACSNGDSTNVTFSAGGSSLGEVIGFMGGESISVPYAYYIAVRKTNAGLNTDSMVGQRGVLVYQGNSGTSYFVGVITQFGLAARDGSEAVYVAKLEPAFGTLERSSGYAIYQDYNLEDLVNLVLTSGGVPSPLFRLTRSYEPTEFEMMYNESPEAFVSRVMERDGVHYHFTHAASIETMIIADTNGGFTSTGLSLKYWGHLQNRGPGGDFIATFHCKSGLYTGTSTVAGYDFKAPNANIYGTYSLGGGIGEKFDYAADITKTTNASVRAQLHAEREFLAGKYCVGISNSAALKAGHIFSLIDESGAGFNGTYLVTKVRHLAVWDEERGCFVYCNVFSAIPSGRTFRPERKTPVPKLPGVVTAVVTGPAGETRYVDEYGRIKVQFRWDREGRSDENSSAWIRVLIPAGRMDDTDLFIPVISSEVVVSFIQGNPSLPFVLGSVYNGVFPPPVPLPGGISETP
jgi:type VI secretion system secreted protein VgrG